MNEYTESVSRGADLLDRERPGWRDRIDVTTLDLSDDCYCILGQVLGGYYNGLSVLWGIDDDALPSVEWLDSDAFQSAVAHGFSIGHPMRCHKWHVLQEAWIAELSGKTEESQ